MAYEKERRVAVDTVLRACMLSQAVRSTLLGAKAISKEDRSPVTIADFAVQALINADLSAAFHGEILVGEEDSHLLQHAKNTSLKKEILRFLRRFNPNLNTRDLFVLIDRGAGKGGPKGRFWTIDPIDGTKGFIRGDQYVVALALIEDGEVIVGVLGCPNLFFDHRGTNDTMGTMFVAVRGEGSFMRALTAPEEFRIGVSAVVEPSQSRFCESYESTHSSHDAASRIARYMGVDTPSLRVDSQCKYALVARGDATAYLRLPKDTTYQEKIWDHAAGAIIVREAGGRVTDVDGKPLDFTQGRLLINNRGVVATNGPLHTPILDAIQKFL